MSQSMIFPTEKIQSLDLNFGQSLSQSVMLGKNKTPQLTDRSVKTNVSLKEKQKFSKKKLQKLRIPQKYEKIVENLGNDQTEILDLTNAQLGDQTIVQICEYLNNSKTKTVKLIRNKITDNCLSKILSNMRGVITLNLSQNLFTDKALDILFESKEYLSSMKSIILSQNKINERKCKPKV